MSQKVILETTSTKPNSNLTQILFKSLFRKLCFKIKNLSQIYSKMNLCVCVQVGVEPPLGKLFNIEFTKYQVQRKNQNIFELFMLDTPLT